MFMVPCGSCYINRTWRVWEVFKSSFEVGTNLCVCVCVCVWTGGQGGRQTLLDTVSLRNYY